MHLPPELHYLTWFVRRIVSCDSQVWAIQHAQSNDLINLPATRTGKLAQMSDLVSAMHQKRVFSLTKILVM